MTHQGLGEEPGLCMQSVSIFYTGSIIPKDVKKRPKGKGKRGECQILRQLQGKAMACIYCPYPDVSQLAQSLPGSPVTGGLLLFQAPSTTIIAMK